MNYQEPRMLTCMLNVTMTESWCWGIFHTFTVIPHISNDDDVGSSCSKQELISSADTIKLFNSLSNVKQEFLLLRKFV